MDVIPCECDFKICTDCFNDAVKLGGAVCPGCKDMYRNTEMEELLLGAVTPGRPLSLPPPAPTKMQRSLSLMNSKKQLMRSQTGEFDHNRWLFETKGTYGYGNAIWPQEEEEDHDDDEMDGDGGHAHHHHHPSQLMAKPWRPLTRKLKVPAAVLSPYRYVHAQLRVHACMH